MATTKELADAMAIVEAERMVETVKLRSEVVTACRNLLPEAIRQAKPKKARKSRDGQHIIPGRPGDPRLLKLIKEIVMQPADVDRRKK